ncbi:PTS beta-glucoside transporter subunit EIIBCA [Listeria monocytogenes]|uniref:glucose PTS transporter subunit IIA n=1 Tax=Listeria monocytogenes TaxID=1639 RepID=UPI0010B70132|nr:glucose PTS transporter subunit IIA [Listeria monocytogenes]EAC5805734.1 PTS beta-glucoside transporter subunit EIIBCA [Listeria monocytogenes]EAC9482209.1 PTS beta-glucoside transporter subunit EIIBCA [Listeria monocytogenes]EHL5826518.1 PTS glucose transporter subunit IIA [Listeria monocytogenes]EKC6210735.1 PTS glucose transporter subunit IIA [Listeria monocytogenes]MDA5918477.1 glucose PTS transporter subunit IIA [Listeria monocytogenes]
MKNEKIYSITSGNVITLQKVNDPIFSEEMMGKGIAIKPDIGEVLAPFDGRVVSVFPTKHAVTLKSDDGLELLIHVGLDTVKLDGDFMESFVEANERIKRGDVLIRFDIHAIERAGYDTVIPVVILNSNSYQNIEVINSFHVNQYDVLMNVTKVPQNQKSKVEETIKTDNSLEQVIVQSLGGENNIVTMGYCATRLRVTVLDESEVNINEIKSLSGVLGVIESMGGYQIVIGNNVDQVFHRITSIYKIGVKDSNEENKEVKKVNVVNQVLNVLSDILSPNVPLIMGSGFISAILIVLTKLGVSSDGSTYIILSTAANVVFYFLPIMLAYTASIRFKCSTVYSLFLGGLLLHPTILELATTGDKANLYGLPVTAVDYSSSLIPIILSVWLLSYVERFADKYVPTSLKYVIKPLVIIMIMVPIVLCITGPAGFLIGKGLGVGITFIHGKAAWLTVILLCALAPALVMTGMHIALTPLIILTNFETLGYDNMLLIAFIGMNFSQFAVALATFLKTKNKVLKGLAASCAITAVFGGVTEPTLYGISIRLKKPLYATFIGCFANGIFCALTNVKIFSFAPPSFFTLPIFMNPDGTNTNFFMAIGAITVTIVVTFAATWILGFDDTVYE